MSGRRSIANEGEALCVEDAQRWMNDAASAEDNVFDTLFIDDLAYTASAGGGIVPLWREHRGAGLLSGGADFHQSVLVIPSSTSGKISVLPALYMRTALPSGVTVGVGQMLLAHREYSVKETSLLGTNASGSQRFVAIYATIARSTTVSAARLVRNSSDSESSQEMSLADETRVTIALTAQADSRFNAGQLVPDESATSFVFVLAYVVIAIGYASGTAIGANSGAGLTTYLEQTWPIASIPATRIRNVYVPTTAKTGIELSSSFRSLYTVACPFKHTTNPQTITLDDGINYSKRIATISMLLPPDAGGGVFPAPDDVTVPSNTGYSYSGSDRVFTAAAGSTFKRFTINGKDYDFKTTAAGALQVTCGHAPNGGAGDNWWATIEVTQQFLKNSY